MTDTERSFGFAQVLDEDPYEPYYDHNQRVSNAQYDKETRIVSETGGEKGQKQCQIGALDAKALQVVGSVAGFGSEKYSRYNFMKGYNWSLSYDAMQRHLMAFWSGEDNDPESGLAHLGHACWHCLCLLTFSIRGRGTDDRPI